MRNLKIAAAVSLALGGITAAHAQATLAQCKGTPADTLYIAGSSAAQNAFGAALATDLFGGVSNELTFKASNGNFEAFCGLAAAGNTAGITPGNLVVVHYRAEGGSVVGALPLVTHKPVKFLDLTNAAVTSTSITTGGTSEAQGPIDAWTGPLTEHTVEVGVTDVEPGILVGANYPTNYSTTVFGSATAAQLSTLAHTALFQEVYGIFVNTSGINGAGTGQILNLNRNTVGAILAGSITDWSQVPSGTGTVSSVPVPITVVNRELGSGTRTGAGIYFLNIGCSGSAAIFDPTPGNDSYATADALAAAAGKPGSITYASIDNDGKQAALSMAHLNGVAASNFNATNGTYDWWTEAQLVKGTITSPGGTTIYTWLTTELAKVSTAPHTTDINAIPGIAGNTPTVAPATPNLIGGTGTPIYINPFTKGGNKTNSCAAPSYL
jgi:hypothetical protein